MPQIKLKVVRDAILPPPWTAPPGAGPLFTGSGDTDYVCGVCEFVIAASMFGAAHRLDRDRMPFLRRRQRSDDRSRLAAWIG
jgi:hypothetical protein